MVREAGLEPARPEWTLEPESSESANSTTRASAVFRLLRYIITAVSYTHLRAHETPEQNRQPSCEDCRFWQGHKDLNPEPTVLETAALPIELYPYL